VVEEAARLVGPAQFLYRRATSDVELGGAVIRGGERLAVSFAAANRDPDAFTDPDAFRPGRGGPAHLGFGSGVHYCLGANLARLEVRVALRVLRERFRTLEPGNAAAIRQASSAVLFGHTSLPLRLGR
jgi:cytochrome P450